MKYSLKMVMLFQVNEYLPLMDVRLPTFALYFYEQIAYTNW